MRLEDLLRYVSDQALAEQIDFKCLNFYTIMLESLRSFSLPHLIFLYKIYLNTTYKNFLY